MNLGHAGDEALKRGYPPRFETRDRRHQKSKTWVSVAPQKELISCKKILFKYCDKNSTLITWILKVRFSPVRIILMFLQEGNEVIEIDS